MPIHWHGAAPTPVVGWPVAAETMWPTQPKRFTLWPFKRKHLPTLALRPSLITIQTSELWDSHSLLEIWGICCSFKQVDLFGSYWKENPHPRQCCGGALRLVLSSPQLYFKIRPATCAGTSSAPGKGEECKEIWDSFPLLHLIPTSK